MGYFKKFSDFCSLFLAFWGAVFALEQFMTYKFAEDSELLDKICVFFSDENYKDMYGYVILVLLLLLSFVSGRLFPRSYYLSFAVSFAPLIWAFVLYEQKKLYTQPELFLVLCGIQCAGNVIDSLSLDRGDKKRRAYLSANIAGGALAAFCFYTYFHARALIESELSSKEFDELYSINKIFYESFDSESLRVILIIGAILLAGVLLSLVFRDIYFVDLLIYLPLCAYVSYVFFSGSLPHFSLCALASIAIYGLCRVAIVLFEPMRVQKKE